MMSQIRTMVYQAQGCMKLTMLSQFLALSLSNLSYAVNRNSNKLRILLAHGSTSQRTLERLTKVRNSLVKMTQTHLSLSKEHLATQNEMEKEL